MRSLKSQVLGFLNSGGYRSAKSAQDVVLVRSRSYRWSSGEIDRNRIMLGSFSGFEIEEIPEGVLVRFAGPGREETRSLDGYARVLGNCGLQVERGPDPQHAGREVIRAFPKP